MLAINQIIPDFELDAFYQNDIKKIKLSDYRGQWLILLFYPADFTFVCPTELEEAAHYHEKFKEINAEIMSVSTDTAFAHLAWHDSSPAIKKINYPMLADPACKLCRGFGTFVEDDGLSVRATFIIDPEGQIKSIEMHDNSIGRSTPEILRKLQAAIYVRENPGLACPASWKPGEESLQTGTDMVNKI